MKAVIRTDSSPTIGSGHLMRCLTLADVLRRNETEVVFVCRNLPGNLSNLCRRNDFSVRLLPNHSPSDTEENSCNDYSHWLGTDWLTDATETENILHELAPIDWLIVDHYALDRRWESCLSIVVNNIMVIDDLANRPHECQLLLDQNFYKQIGKRYEHLVPSTCQQLLGPAYALLRPEFIEARRSLRESHNRIQNILVFMGGADRDNVTAKVIKAIAAPGRTDLSVNVIGGEANDQRENIFDFCRSHEGFNYHERVLNMAEMMMSADLAIGGGGTSTWERCYLRLPAITIILAENQRDMTETLAEYGAIINLGWHTDVTEGKIIRALQSVIENPEQIQKMSRRGQDLFGNNGETGAEKVVAVMKEKCHAIA